MTNDFEAYKGQVTQVIIDNIMQMMAEDVSNYGEDFLDDVLLNLISSLSCDIVLRALDKTNIKAYDELDTKFTKVRYLLQDSLAQGFTAAFFVQDPKSRKEFYCQVNNIRHMNNSTLH